MSRSRIVLFSVSILLAALPATAHEFWIEPSTFTPRVGEHVSISLRVGENFEGTSVPRQASRIERFVVAGRGTSIVPGREGSNPAGLFRPRRSGPHVIAYESDHARIEIDAGRFEAYLRSEGLDSIVADRAARGESDAPGRERYARCAKSLLRVEPDGGSGDEVRSSPSYGPIGLPLELVALSDHVRLEPDRPLSFRLLFRGEPVGGALVRAWRRGAGGPPLTARTDRDGRVALLLDRPGAWLLSSVHMVRASRWEDAEWESYWASLTFERSWPGP